MRADLGIRQMFILPAHSLALPSENVKQTYNKNVIRLSSLLCDGKFFRTKKKHEIMKLFNICRLDFSLIYTMIMAVNAC